MQLSLSADVPPVRAELIHGYRIAFFNSRRRLPRPNGDMNDKSPLSSLELISFKKHRLRCFFYSSMKPLFESQLMFILKVDLLEFEIVTLSAPRHLISLK